MQSAILILDDDESITNGFKRLLEAEYLVFISHEVSNAYDILKNNEIAVIICDYHLKESSGIDFISSLKGKYDLTKKILLSGELDLHSALESINNAKVHMVKQKPWNPDEMFADLKTLVVDYQMHKDTQKKINDYDHIMMQENRFADDILDILSSLDENEKLGEFISSIIKALDGIQSFIEINFQTYLYFKDKISFRHVYKYLTDIELISNQYDQKILIIYSMTLRAYFLALLGDFTESKLYISGAREYFAFIDTKYQNKMIEQALSQYHLPSYNTTFNKEAYESRLEIIINKLLSITINELLVINDKLFAFIQDGNPVIDYFLAIRNDIPLYFKSGKGKDFEPNLISGFLVALSQFLSETVTGGGDIQNISHEKGVILIHKHREYLFIVLSSIDDLWLRVSLRDFAQESNTIFSQIPKNHFASEIQISQINEILDKYFGKF